MSQKTVSRIEIEMGFSKRIFTPSLFLKYLGFLVWHAPNILRVFTNKQNKRLISKIVMITDAVNECIYCSWLDAKLAIKEGICEEEIKNILMLQFHEDVSEYDLDALLFAQHYSETNGIPEPEMTRRLFKYYGESIARDIVVAIKAVTFGNLYFNTWEAMIARFKGNPASNSGVLFEIVFFLLNSIFIVPFIIFRKLDKNAIGKGIIGE